MKQLELSDFVKDLAGFVGPTPAEHMLEEEFKQKMLLEPKKLMISAPGAPMDVNIVIGGKKKPMAPKQDTKKPEKSVKLMNKEREEFKKKFG